MHRDAEYKDTCLKAYNRWLQAMCSEAPNHIFGLAQTAVLSVDSAIEDFRRAREMGMVGMMMPVCSSVLAVKQQLLIMKRARRRVPKLTAWDRLVNARLAKASSINNSPQTG